MPAHVFHLLPNACKTVPAREGRRSLAICSHGSRIEIGVGEEAHTHGLISDQGSTFEWGNPPSDALWIRAMASTVVVVIEE